MAAAKMKITPDAGLATEEAIRFRIEQLQKEGPTKNAKRIAALKLRLPKSDEIGAEILPAVNPALLVSKADIGWGRNPQYYGATHS